MVIIIIILLRVVFETIFYEGAHLFKSVQNRTTTLIKNHDYLIVFTRDRFEAYQNVNICY